MHLFKTQQFFTDRLMEILRKSKRTKVVAWHELYEQRVQVKGMDDVIIGEP